MNERDALLRAILTEPADDTARLVFADYLDEHEQPERAAWVRWRVAEEYQATTVPTGQLISVDPLWIGWEPNWAPRTAEVFSAPSTPGGARYTVRRGFAEGVTLGLSEYLDGVHVFAEQPLTRVEFTDREPIHDWYNQLFTWSFVIRAGLAPECVLPVTFTDLLAHPLAVRYADNGRVTSGSVGFRTQYHAVLACSETAVNLARAAMGLPPLPLTLPTPQEPPT